MSKDLNQCNFIGNIGKQPEIKYTAGGQAIANFSIACGDDYKDKSGEKIERTNWVRVVAFGKLAEIIAEFLDKGSKVFISGKQVTRQWQDKEGVTRYTTEIVANEMQILGGRGGGEARSPGYGQGGRSQSNAQRGDDPFGQGAESDFDDDIPFS